jgi:plasmid stability protein
VSAIQVKNVPEDVHCRLRDRARAEGRTIGQYVLAALERDLAVPSMREWLDSLRQDPTTEIASGEIARLIQEARDERDEQILSAISNRH